MLILLIRSHCKICPLATIRSRVFVLLAIVGNGQILQWDLISKINILRSIDKKYVYTHTGISAPKRFAKFGCQTRTFCQQKVEKAVAKLESDRLYT